MKRTPRRLSAPLGAVALALAFAVAAASRAGAATVTVDDPRPVAEAVEGVAEFSGLAITYEDPPYLYRAGLVDVTQAVSRTADPGPRTLVPKGGLLAFAMPASASPAATFAAVRDLVATYNRTRAAATFAAVRDAAFIHVVPREAADPAGRLAPVAPVLDTRITLAAKPRTALSFLDEFCQALSAAGGQPVRIGMVPSNALENQRVEWGASGEPAREVLQKLILANPTPLAWRLLYDPGLKSYYLNLPVVRPAAGSR
jgi:hypothetical protein